MRSVVPLFLNKRRCDVKVIHPFRALLTSSYGVSADSFGKMPVCSSVVLAAEARKEESASVEAQRTPRPPSLTGKDAWSQRSSSKYTFRMVDKPSVSKSSNRAKLQQCVYCISALGHLNCF